MSLGTMSKFYDLEDLRIDWIIAQKESIERARKLKNWVTIENSVFSEMVACKAFKRRDLFVHRARKFYNEYLALVEKWICDRKDPD